MAMLRSHAEQHEHDDLIEAMERADREQRARDHDPEYQRRLSEERREAEKVRLAEETARWEAASVSAALPEETERRLIEAEKEDKQTLADRTAVQEEAEHDKVTARWNDDQDADRVFTILAYPWAKHKRAAGVTTVLPTRDPAEFAEKCRTRLIARGVADPDAAAARYCRQFSTVYAPPKKPVPRRKDASGRRLITLRRRPA